MLINLGVIGEVNQRELESMGVVSRLLAGDAFVIANAIWHGLQSVFGVSLCIVHASEKSRRFWFQNRYSLWVRPKLPKPDEQIRASVNLQEADIYNLTSTTKHPCACGLRTRETKS